MKQWVGWVCGVLLSSALPAGAAEGLPVLHYSASWAGVPAAQIDVVLEHTGSHYRDEIDIRSEGLPRWFTNFRGDAASEGEFGADGRALPSQYDALYTLRRRRDKRIALRMVDQDGARLAQRGPEDSSNKPPLAEIFRRDVLDPVSALAAIRNYLATHGHAPGGEFTLPVYDGARRFDVVGRIVPPEADPVAGPVVQLALSLRPIAGFKGESSEDGDPDDAARDVDLRFSDDEALVPLYLRVHIALLPLVIRFERRCPALGACRN